MEESKYEAFLYLQKDTIKEIVFLFNFATKYPEAEPSRYYKELSIFSGY